MKTRTLAFIGAGHMGRCLIGGFIENGYSSQHIFASAQHQETLEPLKKQWNIQTSTDNILVANQADVVILAVRPETVPTVCHQLSNSIQKKQSLVISLAAGVTTRQLLTWLGQDVSIVRAMPNISARIQLSATGLFATPRTKPEQREWVESVMRSVGLALWVEDEQHMDIVTALSGSGPAYSFLLMEALSQAGQKAGLDATTAALLTAQTALGSAQMALNALQTDQSIEQLRHSVMSPGGTTEMSMNFLEKKGFSAILDQALQSGIERAKQLSVNR